MQSGLWPALRERHAALMGLLQANGGDAARQAIAARDEAATAAKEVHANALKAASATWEAVAAAEQALNDIAIGVRARGALRGWLEPELMSHLGREDWSRRSRVSALLLTTYLVLLELSLRSDAFSERQRAMVGLAIAAVMCVWGGLQLWAGADAQQALRTHELTAKAAQTLRGHKKGSAASAQQATALERKWHGVAGDGMASTKVGIGATQSVLAPT